MRDQTVLVIGGSRATGLLAVRALVRTNISVRVLARNASAAQRRIGAGAEIVQGDVTKKNSLIPAFAAVNHVIFTAGVRSGRFTRESTVRATEYEGVLNTIDAARARSFRGRFVYMTAIGVTRPSLFGTALNIWKGNTLKWRGRAEAAIRASGLDYTIVRAAFLVNRAANRRAISVRQTGSPLTLFECIARADVAEALVAAVSHPDASRATIEVAWARGPRDGTTWASLLSGLRPD